MPWTGSAPAGLTSAIMATLKPEMHTVIDYRTHIPPLNGGDRKAFTRELPKSRAGTVVEAGQCSTETVLQPAPRPREDINGR